MPFNKGKFGPAAKMNKPAGQPSESKPEGKPQGQEHKDMQAPHGQEKSVEHVTKTHPGETQPHPETGVHAFHGHHVGGGKFKSHTHHDGGDVETRDHQSADEMHQAGQEALPSSGQEQAPAPGMQDPNMLSGIGGEMQS